MTRDEAIAENVKYFRTTLQIQSMTRSEDEIRKMAAAQVDFYVAIGVLKLDEPKSELSVDQRVARVIGEWKGTHEGMNGFLNRMEAVGLKIVQA